MSNDDTLLAYLVPKLTSRVEDAATDGLGYILKKSVPAIDALNGLLRQGGFSGNPIVRVESQVAYEDGTRPDMTGYDEHDGKRLLVEVKFWAALGETQASDYLGQLDEPGAAMLLFIAPQARIETLWAQINRQVEADGRRKLDTMDSSDAFQTARLAGEEKRLMLISWRTLLAHLAASADTEEVKGDILQLQGLAEGQDTHAFLPLHCEDVSPEVARRISNYKTLVDDVVEREVSKKWLNIEKLKVTPQVYGYGRFFRFSNIKGDFWIGVNCEKWAEDSDTPLWLWVGKDVQKSMIAIGTALGIRVFDRWIPIRLRRTVEYRAVLDDVTCQLKEIGRVVGAIIPDD